MNEPIPAWRIILGGALIGALVIVVPLLLLEIDLPVRIGSTLLAALIGAVLGWLYTKLA